MTSITASAVLLFAQGCETSSFLGIDPWYKYIKRSAHDGFCTLDFQTHGVGTFLLVLGGIIDILMRIGIYVAVGFFIYGVIRMISSQGSPETIKASRNTMVNALIGVVICIIATWLTSFLMETLL